MDGGGRGVEGGGGEVLLSRTCYDVTVIIDNNNVQSTELMKSKLVHMIY